jgi:hypothetical protein
MGVLGLHNEGPPVNHGPEETKAICYGLALDEDGTAALLRALADCFNSMAAMDETVRNIVATWSALADSPDPSSNLVAQHGLAIRESYANSFTALNQTVERINGAIDKYRELTAYAVTAAEAGRGGDFSKSLDQLTGTDFDTLVRRRMSGLRKLKVRVKLLQQLEQTGVDLINSYNFNAFFTTFMQPIRDVALEVQSLYNEVILGALASHEALMRTDDVDGERQESAQPPAAAAVGNGSAHVGNGHAATV